jgi:hypothetical protein
MRLCKYCGNSFPLVYFLAKRGKFNKMCRNCLEGCDVVMSAQPEMCDNGTVRWTIYGKLHRSDDPITGASLPAVEYQDGGKEWWICGQLHRTDGPAVERINGDRVWYEKGKCHRAAQPAFQSIYGDKAWYWRGQLHRNGGPAIQLSDGKEYWYVHGVEFTDLRRKLKGVWQRRRWRLFIRRAARMWHLAPAIEWRPPHGVRFVEMMASM